MKWSCQTSKEEIISLIKVFFSSLSPSANQNSSARERLIRSKEHSRILSQTNAEEGDEEKGTKRGTQRKRTKEGGGEKRDIAHPLHIITAWSLSPLSASSHPAPASPTQAYSPQTQTHGEGQPWEGTGTRRPSASQGENSHQNLAVMPP